MQNIRRSRKPFVRVMFVVDWFIATKSARKQYCCIFKKFRSGLVSVADIFCGSQTTFTSQLWVPHNTYATEANSGRRFQKFTVCLSVLCNTCVRKAHPYKYFCVFKSYPDLCVQSLSWSMKLRVPELINRKSTSG